MSLSTVEIVEKVLVMFFFFKCGLVLWGSLEKV